MTKFERKFGKYAIKHLQLILITCYAVGYLLELLSSYTGIDILGMLTLDVDRIIHGFQIWRVITWLLVPPSEFSIFTIVMLYFYFSIGTSLENTWGAYRFNIYFFSGVLFTILGAFVIYFAGIPYSPFWISTYYVNMSIFLAYSATFPQNRVLLFFVIPIRVMILGIIYGALLVYDIVQNFRHGYLGVCIIIFASLLNFLVFFLIQRKNLHRYSSYNAYSRQRVKQQRETTVEKPKFKPASGVTRHKCSICDKTDESNPELEFRFCSKCNGNYEYCSDHLFTHMHIV